MQGQASNFIEVDHPITVDFHLDLPDTLHYMNEYQKQIIRYKHLRSIYYSDSENRVSLEDKEFKSMLIQLKRSIMAKRNRTNENQILFKSEFPEE